MTLSDQPAAGSLAGRWALSDTDGEHRCQIDLPGDGVSALNRAGLIPDPYWGRNEYGLRWISERDWTASRSFELTDTEVDLVLDGLDTVATVRVNGIAVLEAANSFRTYRVPLAQAARTGANQIEITFHSPVVAGAERQAAQPFFVPYSASNNPIANGNMLRKVQCDFGWDWNIALAPFGLYGDIRIELAAAPRIDRLQIAQSHRPGRASVSVTAFLAQAQGQRWRFEFAGQTMTGVARADKVTVTFDIDEPDLWWPAGLGQQVLHDLNVIVGSATQSRRIGLRSMELLTDKDDAGSRFAFRVNGHEVFAKGANWIPADALAGRITVDATRGLLQSAVDAHMNMIRVWGGGRYEPDWFYDLCDELGLMVWQDFMFACSLYPSTPDFLAEVRAEVHDNVARMHHHACLALWCGDNELVGALTWFPESRDNRDRYLVNYDRLNRAIETALVETDPQAIWWPSSPSSGPLDFGDAWHDDSSGDMHFWSVWHEGKDFDHYRDVSPRFCSEFGFQSYPSMSAIRKFADPADWNIASPVFESHQKNAGGNARIAETMFRYFRWPERFEDFVWLSQIQQGLAIKTAVTQWRSNKPHCMGTLIWQLNDTWPVCSWSSLDHGGNWKLLHHMARHFFQPVLVSAVPSGDRIVLKVTNDQASPLEVTVTARAVNPAGLARALGAATVSVADRSVEALALSQADLAADEFLAFSWHTQDGPVSGDVFAPRPYKTYDLVPPRLTCDALEAGGIWHLTLNAEALALFATVESDLPGRFSANAFAIFPGQSAEITFTPDAPGPAPSFTLRDLHSATMTRNDT